MDEELLQEVKRLTKWCGDGRFPDRCNSYPHKELRANLPHLKRRLAKRQRELNQMESAIADAENILVICTKNAQDRLEKEFADYVNSWKRAQRIARDRNNGMNWAQLKRKYQLTRVKLERLVTWAERCPKRMSRAFYFKTY